MSSSKDQLASLLSKSSLDDHEEVLQAANAAIRANRNDLRAQHVRAVALLKLDRFDDALKQFEDAGEKLKSGALLEYAYALYKCGRLRDAQKVAQGAKQRGTGHVLVQATYRLEEFSKAKEIYSKLSETADQGVVNEENDLRINSGAVDAQLEWVGNGDLVAKKKPAREDLEAFESAYNAACCAIGRGSMGEAEVLLRRAKDLCEASEDLTEEEKRLELLPILVQRTYVLERLGRIEEAEKTKQGIDIREISDPATRHIAQVNKLAATSDSTNPYTAQRKFSSTPKLPSNEHPFSFQTNILSHDEHMLSLLVMKHESVTASTARELTAHSGSITPHIAQVGVLNAAAHAKLQTGKPAIKATLPLLEERPNDVGLVLTVIQLYLLTNNSASATSLLESFFERLEHSTTPQDQDIRFAPGLVGTLVSLYTLQNRRSQIRAELAKASTFWRRKSKQDSTQPPVGLSKAAGTALLESSNQEDLKLAGEIFQELHSQSKDDRFTNAGLVSALAGSGSSVPESLTSSLTPINRLTASIDAATLEDAGIARAPSALQTATTSQKRLRDAKATKETRPHKKKPRLRGGKLPKDLVEGKEPDPERWLPLKDRSYYRPKGKKGKKRAEGLTQGGVVKDEGTPAPAAPVTGGGGGGGGGKKKKKGKK